MSPIDEAPSFEPKPPAAESKPAPAEGRKPKASTSATERPQAADLVTLTVDAATGRIVNVERLDANGDRQQVSEADRARLSENGTRVTLERVVEQAFEAGIDYVLGAEPEADEPPQSDEDAELSRILLRSIIEASAAKRLLGREILSRAIVATLVEQAAHAPTSNGAAAH